MSTSATTTSNPVDPLQTLNAALTVTSNSAEQAELLATLRESLEAQPTTIRTLVGVLIATVVNASDSLLKRWVVDLLHYAICRSALSLDEKTQLSLQVLDTLAKLLDDPTQAIVKVAIQCFTTVYPLLFRHLCINRTNAGPWNVLSHCKARILALVEAPGVKTGVRVTAVKFMQRVILVQTRGISDPRLQNKQDPNISACPSDHPFISASALESEGQRLLYTIVSTLLSTQNVDVLSAILNSWASLCKLRPGMTTLIINTLSRWTPEHLQGLSPSSVKSVEKAIRILLIHISRIPTSTSFHAQVNEILSAQADRMDKATIEEKQRRTAGQKRPVPEIEPVPDAKRLKLDNGTAQPSTNILAAFDFTTLPASLITDLIVANLDAFSEAKLTELVQRFRQQHGLVSTPSEPAPKRAEVPPPIRADPRRTTPISATAPVAFPSMSTPTTAPVSAPLRSITPATAPVQPVKAEEPIDPLQMDIDQEELEFEPDRLNEELSGPLPAEVQSSQELPSSAGPVDISLADFKLPAPKELDDSDRTALVNAAIQRIREGVQEIRASFVDAGVSPDSYLSGAKSATDMSMLLLVRVITRVTKPPKNMSGVEEDEDEDDEVYYQRQDAMRQTLCDYIMADFPARLRLAVTWMNEEWYNDRIRQQLDGHKWRLNYETWLNQIVSRYETLLEGKDRSFSKFLLDLPDIPADILTMLREFCVDTESSEKMQTGFTTLRGFVIQRPALRSDALNVLLELTTHSNKRTRGAAINTVKLWVPNHQPMDTMVRVFALQMLRKLQRAPVVPSKTKNDATVSPSKMEVDKAEIAEAKQVISQGSAPSPAPKAGTNGVLGVHEAMEDGQLPQEELVQTQYLPDRIQLPARKGDVLQHVELLFALSVKVSEFLEEIFAAYGQMDVSVQEAIQELLTPLIRSLGSNHAKLLTLMRQCPPGAETLALRVLTIFTEHGRPSPQLVSLAKALIHERDLDARFLIPIIAEMDKPDIIRHLPRIVRILNGEAEPKNLVRSVFSSIVTTPPQSFGSVSSNLPRVRQSELLTPAELMVLLHDSEKEIGIKSAVEAIGICFSMTDVYRSEILAVVMQQIMDKPVLPVLFLRTVIQAVTTYKSLIGFVSTTLLSRLITKKIWTNPPLWEGFIRCAKAIAPASFGALLQLPKDQLRELVDKQPTLKAGLRDYVMKKATNKARVSGFLDIFGDGPPEAEGSGGVKEENVPPAVQVENGMDIESPAPPPAPAGLDVV